MYVVFFKGPGNIFDKVIRWWTKGTYSHCELVFSDNTSFSADIKMFKTRFKKVTYCKDDWDIFEVNVTSEEEQTMRKFCEDEDGCWYDIVGILFTQFIPLSFENPWWWFCSEVGVATFKQISEFEEIEPFKCDPDKFYKLLMESDRLKTNWKNV